MSQKYAVKIKGSRAWHLTRTADETHCGLLIASDGVRAEKQAINPNQRCLECWQTVYRTKPTTERAERAAQRKESRLRER